MARASGSWVIGIVFAACSGVIAGHARAEPSLVLKSDNTELRSSTTVSADSQNPIVDADGNGVLHVLADDVTIDFAAGSVLRGAVGTNGDQLKGVGIRIDGRKNVTIRGACLRGFRIGIWATNADGLIIDGADIADGYRMRLKSTPGAEDQDDWLWPHKNDQQQWRATYGGAIVIENSRGVVVRNARVREAQNGIILDRVDGSRVYDNDCSFLSGWGLAMWRSGGNVISRNAFDFCIRGYSHGVYNRGQDSAGILMFEQCSQNIIAENSATHCGDGFFGFAGRDALGEGFVESERERLRVETGRKDVDDLLRIPVPMLDARKRSGCNDNLLIDNDFSFSAAHGIEITFSFGNRIIGNRLVGNAICGVWGGYSAETLISGNYFEANGGAGYGEERGGVNVEHGRDNRVIGNTFVKNVAGVHLWARPNPRISRVPWVMANAEADSAGAPVIPSARNIIAGNTFEGDQSALRLCDSTGTVYTDNTAKNVVNIVDTDSGTELIIDEPAPAAPPAPMYETNGKAHPAGARAFLDGRENIIMTEWGAWDHSSTLFRERQRGPKADVYEVFGVRGEIAVAFADGSPSLAIVQRPARSKSGVPAQVLIAAPGPGVWPYTAKITGTGIERAVSGVLVATPWVVRIWPWTADPVKNIEAWRAEATGDKAIAAEFDALDLPFGYRSPSAMNLAPVVSEANLPRERFGLIARTALPLKAGSWTIRTLSDDGVRVTVDGRTIIDRWDIHGPTPDEATITLAHDADVKISVEYFQNDGFATLSVSIRPADTP